jgi:hypothetical protein
VTPALIILSVQVYLLTILIERVLHLCAPEEQMEQARHIAPLDFSKQNIKIKILGKKEARHILELKIKVI